MNDRETESRAAASRTEYAAGSIRTLEGLLPISDVLAAGVVSVKTMDGESVTDGMILTDKMRPARRDGQPILFVERQDDHWLPLKLD